MRNIQGTKYSAVRKLEFFYLIGVPSKKINRNAEFQLKAGQAQHRCCDSNFAKAFANRAGLKLANQLSV